MSNLESISMTCHEVFLASIRTKNLSTNYRQVDILSDRFQHITFILTQCLNETLKELNSYCHKNQKNKSCLPNNGAFKAFPAINHNKLTLTRFSDLFRTTLKCNVLCIAAATIGFRFFIEFLHFKVHFVEQQKSRCKFLAPRSRALCVLVFSFGLLLSSILLLLQLQ